MIDSSSDTKYMSSMVMHSKKRCDSMLDTGFSRRKFGCAKTRPADLWYNYVSLGLKLHSARDVEPASFTSHTMLELVGKEHNLLLTT